MCAFSPELILSFHLQDGVITIVNIQAKVKPQFRVTAEQVSPMSMNPLGYPRTQILHRKIKCLPYAFLEILHINESTRCCGLE